MTSVINYQKLFVTLFLCISSGIFFLPYIIEALPMKQTCLFSSLTGHPSPTCGTTRALVSLLHLNPSLAFHFNPLATITWLSAFAVALSTVFLREPIHSSFPFKSFIREKLGLFLFLPLGINWIYLLWQEDFLKQNSLGMIPLLF